MAVFWISSSHTVRLLLVPVLDSACTVSVAFSCVRTCVPHPSPLRMTGLTGQRNVGGFLRTAFCLCQMRPKQIAPRSPRCRAKCVDMRVPVNCISKGVARRGNLSMETLSLPWFVFVDMQTSASFVLCVLHPCCRGTISPVRSRHSNRWTDW